MFGISHARIIQQAKKFPEEWKRDLTQRVRDIIQRKIITSPVTTEGDEDSIIEAAADRALEVIKRHRTSIARLAEAETKLLEELYNNPQKIWVGQYQGKIITKKVGIASTEVATALHALAGVQEKRIRMERQAFGIPDDAKPTEDPITGIIITPIASINGGEDG